MTRSRISSSWTRIRQRLEDDFSDIIRGSGHLPEPINRFSSALHSLGVGPRLIHNFFRALGCYSKELSQYESGFDDHHLDTKRSELAAQAVRDGLHRVLC